MKVQGQKGKCKDDIKSYSLDRFEQVERSKKKFRIPTVCIVRAGAAQVPTHCQLEKILIPQEVLT